MDKSNEVINIEPENFPELQRLIGEIGGKKLFEASEEKFNPKNQRAKEIIEKMKKARKRLAKAKAAERGETLSNNSFLSRYIRTVAIGTSNPLEAINNMTLFQLNSLMQSYLAWEAYDLEIKSRLAGAKSDKEIVHWTNAGQSNKDDGIGHI